MRELLPLETESLLVRQAVMDDAGELYELSREAAYQMWLSNQGYDDVIHARGEIAFLIDQYSDPGNPRHGPYVLVIEHKADRAIIGHVGFSPLDDDVEIGFAIALSHQRRGLANEALVAACRWAFTSFRLERILGIAASGNTASRRAMERAGFAHQEDRLMMFQGTEQPVSVYLMTPDA